jgi:hypothetical protein
VTGAGLSLNSHGRYETNTQMPLNLVPGQYIASVMYRGGFTMTGGFGSFCMYYYVDHPVFGPSYPFPLGCIDTFSQVNTPATLVFTPDAPIPPPPAAPPFDFTFPYLIGAAGNHWSVPSAADIQGTLSIWLCVKNSDLKSSGPPDKGPPGGK